MREASCVRTFARRVDAVATVLDWVEDYAAARSLTDALIGEAMLVVEELFTNHVRHQPPSTEPIEIGLRHGDDGSLDIELVDQRAVAFDPRPADATVVDVPGREHEQGGRGLFLVRTLASSLHYEFEDGVAITRVRLPPHRSDAV
jgi:anti-sigma regulatory factor (Ser/Thr protein kinase)